MSEWVWNSGRKNYSQEITKYWEKKLSLTATLSTTNLYGLDMDDIGLRGQVVRCVKFERYLIDEE